MIQTHINFFCSLELTFHDGGRYFIETSRLKCSADQWTGFYMMSASVVKGLKTYNTCIPLFSNLHIPFTKSICHDIIWAEEKLIVLKGYLILRGY